MRKQYNVLIIAILAIMFDGCSKITGVTPTEAHYRYFVGFSFVDALGNDLVSPLSDERWKVDKDVSYWTGAINPDRYDLGVDFAIPNSDNPNIKEYVLWMAKYDENHKMTSLFGEEFIEGNGKYYLCSDLAAPSLANMYDKGQGGMIQQKTISYKIICPTIFGDNSTHEIVTYWSYDSVVPATLSKTWTFEQFPTCFSATFDGKEVPVLYFQENHIMNHFIDIVLDR